MQGKQGVQRQLMAQVKQLVQRLLKQRDFVGKKTSFSLVGPPFGEEAGPTLFVFDEVNGCRLELSVSEKARCALRRAQMTHHRAIQDFYEGLWTGVRIEGPSSQQTQDIPWHFVKKRAGYLDMPCSDVEYVMCAEILDAILTSVGDVVAGYDHIVDLKRKTLVAKAVFEVSQKICGDEILITDQELKTKLTSLVKIDGRLEVGLTFLPPELDDKGQPYRPLLFSVIEPVSRTPVMLELVSPSEHEGQMLSLLLEFLQNVGAVERVIYDNPEVIRVLGSLLQQAGVDCEQISSLPVTRAILAQYFTE